MSECHTTVLAIFSSFSVSDSLTPSARARVGSEQGVQSYLEVLSRLTTLHRGTATPHTDLTRVNPVFFHEKPGRRTSCSFGASGVSRKFNFESFNKTPQGRTAVLSASAMRVALLFAAAVLPVALSANPAFNHIAGLHLNASSFYTTLHAGDAGRWFLLFFSRNCGHCAALLPAWQELEERLGASVRAVRLGAIDAESEKVVADRVDIHGFPTLMAIEAGWLYEYHCCSCCSRPVLTGPSSVRSRGA